MIGEVRAALGRRGARLVDRSAADVIVELRCGALSIDVADWVFGIPSMSLPVPAEGRITVAPTPEISLYSLHERTGVAEVSALAIDAHTGAYKGSAAPAFGSTRLVGHRLLTALTRGKQEVRPDR